MQLVYYIVLLIAVVGAPAASARNLTGRDSVIDGDTINTDSQRIRLQGLDAPEQVQTCLARGREWSCGQRATTALRGLIGSQRVACRDEGPDRYGRTIGFCWAGETDIGQWLVRGGHAVAYWRYSWRYGLDEVRARMSGAGVWQGFSTVRRLAKETLVEVWHAYIG